MAVLEKVKDTPTDGSDRIREYAEKFFRQQNIIKTANEILKIAGDGEPYTLKTIYQYRLYSQKLVKTGYGIDDEYYESIDDNDSSCQYSVWDALDGEPEAAGNIDYEW